jgi:hypothetical protein
VEAAVQQVEEAIDAKIAPYRGNAIVENMAEQLKGKISPGDFCAILT